jgi:hypothetical protein
MDDTASGDELPTYLPSLDQLAERARIVAALVTAIGLVILLTWAWTLVRLQQHPGPSYFSFNGDGDTGGVVNRIDAATTNVAPLAYGALALAAGSLLRLVAASVDRRPTSHH